MIKKIKLLFIFILLPSYFFSQDGSDILYVKTSEIDKNIIGKFIHIDFNHLSFGRKRIQDTVNLSVKNQNVKFLEIRKDTRFNNWFSEQSLLSISKIKRKKLQIEKFKLTGLDDKNLYVIAFINYLDHGKITSKIEENMAIEKSNIIEVLVKKE